MNLFQSTRAALVAAVMAGGLLGASIAPTLANAQDMQQTVTLFTSPYATQDPAKAFNAPDSPLYFWGVVQSTASAAVVQSGTVIMYDGNNPIAQVPVSGGQFSVTIPAFSAQTLDRGTHLLTAIYQGDDPSGLYAPSQSPVFTEVIQGQHF
jgi:hypothetical protein